MYESVIELMYIENYLFSFAILSMYLTLLKTVSNLATCSSTTDGEQIISNDSLFITNGLS